MSELREINKKDFDKFDELRNTIDFHIHAIGATYGKDSLGPIIDTIMKEFKDWHIRERKKWAMGLIKDEVKITNLICNWLTEHIEKEQGLDHICAIDRKNCIVLTNMIIAEIRKKIEESK